MGENRVNARAGESIEKKIKVRGISRGEGG